MQETDHPIKIRQFALIDALKGIASIFVVWSHTVEKEGFFYEFIFDPGKIGVVVFFFISGYLVIPSATRDQDVSHFLIKRMSRLYPLYWVSICVAYLMWSEDFSLVNWIANLTMAQQLIGFDNVINVYWTLTIEFCLYVVIATFLVVRPDLLSKNINYMIYAFGVICVATGFARMHLEVKVPVAIPLGLFTMFVGAKLRHFWEHGESTAQFITLYIIVVTATCLMAYSFSTGFNERPSRYILTYVIGGTIFFTAYTKPQLDFGKIPRLVGHYSYGIYLFHIPVMVWLEQSLVLGLGLKLFFLVILITTIVSIPFYYFLEKPIAEYGRRKCQSS